MIRTVEHRLRTSSEQFSLIIEFMESNGDLARAPLGIQGRLRCETLWQALTDLLNSVGSGTQRSAEKWKKVWSDWKTKTKKKASHIARGNANGGEIRASLSLLEKRVLALMTVGALARQDVTPPHNQPPKQYPVEFEDSTGWSSVSAQHFVPQEFVVEENKETSENKLGANSDEDERPIKQEQLLEDEHITPEPAPINKRPLGVGPARQRRIQRTPFERASKEFANVERHRLQYERDREIMLHERETERLRIESRRLDIEEERNNHVRRLLDIIESTAASLCQKFT